MDFAVTVMNAPPPPPHPSSTLPTFDAFYGLDVGDEDVEGEEDVDLDELELKYPEDAPTALPTLPTLDLSMDWDSDMVMDVDMDADADGDGELELVYPEEENGLPTVDEMLRGSMSPLSTPPESPPSSPEIPLASLPSLLTCPTRPRPRVDVTKPILPTRGRPPKKRRRLDVPTNDGDGDGVVGKQQVLGLGLGSWLGMVSKRLAGRASQRATRPQGLVPGGRDGGRMERVMDVVDDDGAVAGVRRGKGGRVVLGDDENRQGGARPPIKIRIKVPSRMKEKTLATPPTSTSSSSLPTVPLVPPPPPPALPSVTPPSRLSTTRCPPFNASDRLPPSTSKPLASSLSKPSSTSSSSPSSLVSPPAIPTPPSHVPSTTADPAVEQTTKTPWDTPCVRIHDGFSEMLRKTKRVDGSKVVRFAEEDEVWEFQSGKWVSCLLSPPLSGRMEDAITDERRRPRSPSLPPSASSPLSHSSSSSSPPPPAPPSPSPSSTPSSPPPSPRLRRRSLSRNGPRHFEAREGVKEYITAEALVEQLRRRLKEYLETREVGKESGKGTVKVEMGVLAAKVERQQEVYDQPSTLVPRNAARANGIKSIEHTKTTTGIPTPPPSLRRPNHHHHPPPRISQSRFEPHPPSTNLPPSSRMIVPATPAIRPTRDDDILPPNLPSISMRNRMRCATDPSLPILRRQQRQQQQQQRHLRQTDHSLPSKKPLRASTSSKDPRLSTALPSPSSLSSLPPHLRHATQFAFTGSFTIIAPLLNIHDSASTSRSSSSSKRGKPKTNFASTVYDVSRRVDKLADVLRPLPVPFESLGAGGEEGRTVGWRLRRRYVFFVNEFRRRAGKAD
ncbi:hypothetical protein ONZ45_g12610 [Pleurotus djamor]|nr:hypothetical protein ONZ45_g12610 [Pleurotus djamor]